MKKIIFFASAVIASIIYGQAAVIFNGTDSTLDFNASSGSYSIGDVTLTLAANDGIVNATSSGLGINGSLSGDDTHAIDTTNLTEILTVSFNVDVIVNSFTFSEIGVNDALDVSFNGASAISITSSGTSIFDTTLLAGQLLTLTAVAPNAPTNQNNGVVITQFQVTQIPEPSSLALLGFATLGGLVRRQR